MKKNFLADSVLISIFLCYFVLLVRIFFCLKYASLNLYDPLVRFDTFSWLLWQFFGPLSKDFRVMCVKVLDKLFTDWSLLPLWDLMFIKDDFCLYNHAEIGKIFGKLLSCCLQKKYILVNQDAATSTFTSKKEQQNNFLLHSETWCRMNSLCL